MLDGQKGKIVVKGYFQNNLQANKKRNSGGNEGGFVSHFYVFHVCVCLFRENVELSLRETIKESRFVKLHVRWFKAG